MLLFKMYFIATSYHKIPSIILIISEIVMLFPVGDRSVSYSVNSDDNKSYGGG